MVRSTLSRHKSGFILCEKSLSLSLSHIVLSLCNFMFVFPAGTSNSEERPSYMRSTASAHLKDRSTVSIPADSEETTPNRGKPSSKDVESGETPSYMRPTNRYLNSWCWYCQQTNLPFQILDRRRIRLCPH